MTETKIASKNNKARLLRKTFPLDRRLFAAVIKIDLAYCDTLFRAGILTRLESEKLKNGLNTLFKRADYDGRYFETADAENVHDFVAGRLLQLAGETADKIGFGRVRREQTANALRVWLREKLIILSHEMRKLQNAILRSAESDGFQQIRIKDRPVIYADWSLNWCEAWDQERERLDEVWRRVNVFNQAPELHNEAKEEIDFEEFARDLGFEGFAENISAGQTDFALEFINAAIISMIRLAQFAEQLKEICQAPDCLGIGEVIEADHSNVIGHQSTLNTVFSKPAGGQYFSPILNAVFETFDILKADLAVMTEIFEQNRKDILFSEPALLSDQLRDKLFFSVKDRIKELASEE